MALSLAAGADPRVRYFDLASVYVPVAIAVFVIVGVMVAVPVLRHRASRGAAPSRRSGAPRLEAAYAGGLVVIAGVLVWRTFAAMGAVDPVTPSRASPRAPASGLTVRVVAAKWNWRFEYPGGVVQQGVARRPAVLVVPANETVSFRLTSLDVAHAFWIPAAKDKYDAYPGRTNAFDMAFEPGVDYRDNRCSEFCGQYHEQMTFDVEVRSPAAFDRWLAARRRGLAR